MRFAYIFILLASASLLSAMSLRPIEIEDQLITSEAVVRAEVLKTSTEREGSHIYTKVKIRVKEAFSGATAGEEIEFRMLGGELDGEKMIIPGMPTFKVGDDIILPLTGGPVPTPSGAISVFPIVRNAAGVEMVSVANSMNVGESGGDAGCSHTSEGAILKGVEYVSTIKEARPIQVTYTYYEEYGWIPGYSCKPVEVDDVKLDREGVDELFSHGDHSFAGAIYEELLARDLQRDADNIVAFNRLMKGHSALVLPLSTFRQYIQSVMKGMPSD